MTRFPRIGSEIPGAISSVLEAWRPRLVELSHALHADPECGGEEHRAASRVAALLAEAGFAIAPPFPGLPTAVSARRGSGEFVVAVCIEYDALPEIGHGCGHNVHGAAALGAAIALAEVCDDLGITVHALGTPAEETTGGKVDLIEAGAFDDATCAVMAHASHEHAIRSSSLALSMWDVHYAGRPAHAATAPHEGINALDALVVAQTAIGLARQQLPPGCIVSVIVTEGGRSRNVIPDSARASVEVRAPSFTTLQEVKQRITACFEAGALATGAELTLIPFGHDIAELRQDRFLSDEYRSALEREGRTVSDLDGAPIASTDMGNVSQFLPSIHPALGYARPGIAHHTAAFAAQGIGPAADEAILVGARALAAAVAAAAASPEQRARLLGEQLLRTVDDGRAR